MPFGSNFLDTKISHLSQLNPSSVSAAGRDGLSAYIHKHKKSLLRETLNLSTDADIIAIAIKRGSDFFIFM